MQRENKNRNQDKFCALLLTVSLCFPPFSQCCLNALSKIQNLKGIDWKRQDVGKNLLLFFPWLSLFTFTTDEWQNHGFFCNSSGFHREGGRYFKSQMI